MYLLVGDGPDTLPVAVTDYANALADVTAYSDAITRANLPLLTGVPAWYTQFLNAWVHVKGNALLWEQTYAPDLFGGLQGIVGISDLIRSDIISAKAELDALIEDPNSSEAKKAVEKFLTSIRTLLKAHGDSAATNLANLGAYRDMIAADADTLRAVVSQTDGWVGSDEGKIKQFNDLIGQLQSDISYYREVITAANMASNVGWGILGLGVVIGLIPGGQTGGLALIGIGVATEVGSAVAKIMADNKIKSDLAAISLAQGQIGDLNTQIGVLRALQGQLDHLVRLADVAAGAMLTLTQLWSPVSDDFTRLLKSLQTVEVDNQQAAYARAKADLVAVSSEWQALVDLVTPFSDFSIQTGQAPIILKAA